MRRTLVQFFSLFGVGYYNVRIYSEVWHWQTNIFLVIEKNILTQVKIITKALRESLAISIHSRPLICEWKSNGALISRKTALLLTVQERVSERSRDTGWRAQSVFSSSSPAAVKTDAVHDTRYTGHRDTRAQGESELQKHEAVAMSKKWNNI